jgi:hypothetical protein
MATCWGAVLDIFVVAAKVPAKFRRDDRDVLSVMSVSLAVFHLLFYLSKFQNNSSLWQTLGHETVQEKAKCIENDFERVYADLARADARRVVWSFLNRSHEYGGAVAGLIQLVCSLEEILSLEGMPRSSDGFADKERRWIDHIGVAIWHVTCNFTHSPAPPVPPPPYTLYASNIELPPIEWLDTSEPEARLWSTKSEVGRKRSPAKGQQRAIIQNLIYLANISSAVSESKQQALIVEILDDSDEEGGAPLPECTREGHKSPICKQERMRLPSPKRHISLPVPGDTVSARNRFASAEHPADVVLDVFSSAMAIVSWELRQQQKIIQFDAVRPLD